MEAKGMMEKRKKVKRMIKNNRKIKMSYDMN